VLLKYTEILKCVELLLTIIHKFDIWEQNRKNTWEGLYSAQLLYSCSVTSLSSEKSSDNHFSWLQSLLQCSVSSSYTVQSCSMCPLFNPQKTNLLTRHKPAVTFCKQHWYSSAIIPCCNIFWPCCKQTKCSIPWNTWQLKNYDIICSQFSAQLTMLPVAPQNIGLVIYLTIHM
jgi:hypothetical protein